MALMRDALLRAMTSPMVRNCVVIKITTTLLFNILKTDIDRLCTPPLGYLITEVSLCHF